MGGIVKNDFRFDYFNERFSAAFPKMAGAKIEKITGDDIKDTTYQFCDCENRVCLVVPETIKIDLILPSKLAKEEVLLFIKLMQCTLTSDNINHNVTIITKQFLIGSHAKMTIITLYFFHK